MAAESALVLEMAWSVSVCETHQQNLIDRGSYFVDTQLAQSLWASTQTGFTLPNNIHEAHEVSPEMFKGELSKPSFRQWGGRIWDPTGRQHNYWIHNYVVIINSFPQLQIASYIFHSITSALASIIKHLNS